MCYEANLLFCNILAEIVVGAPFEADGRGAVYVFNGHRSGIWSEFTQHVQARHVNMLLRGFGVSFSRPMSIENKTGTHSLA